MRLETEPGVHARECTYVFACVYMCMYVQLSQCLVNIGLRRGQIPKQSSHMKSYIIAKLEMSPLTQGVLTCCRVSKPVGNVYVISEGISVTIPTQENGLICKSGVMSSSSAQRVDSICFQRTRHSVTFMAGVGLRP